MKAYVCVALSSAFLVACTVNTGGNAQSTSWGKEAVSMDDYRKDSEECQLVAALQARGGGQANAAGGINGSNPAAPMGSGGASAVTSAGNTTSTATPIGGGGVYRDMASPDVANRMANQQQAQEVAVKRAMNDALRSCLTERGYAEFKLTPEQRAELAKLAPGSEARRAYLHKLASARK